MGSLPLKNKVMSNQLIVKNSNIEVDSLSLKLILSRIPKKNRVNLYFSFVHYEDMYAGFNQVYPRSTEMFPNIFDDKPDVNPSIVEYVFDTIEDENSHTIPIFYKYYVEKGKNILLKSEDYFTNTAIGYIISDNPYLKLTNEGNPPENNFINLDLITVGNNSVYTIPENASNLYLWVIYTTVANNINFTHFIKGEEEKLKTKFKGVPRGEKLNHIFEDINQSNSEFISEEVPYSARYEGVAVIDKNKNVYLYSTEKDLSKIEEIKSDIRFNLPDFGEYQEDWEGKYNSYKIIEPLYDDETVTTHPHFNLTKVGHPISVIINKGTKTDNYPFYSASIQSTESLIFELSSEVEVDITNMDIEFYVGDSFSRAYKIPFNKIGKNTLSLELLQHSSFRVKSEDLNIYCIIKDNGKMKIYKIVNHNIISVSIID